MPGSSSIPVRSYHGIGVALAPDEEIQEIREQEQPKGKRQDFSTHGIGSDIARLA